MWVILHITGRLVGYHHRWVWEVEVVHYVRARESAGV